MGSYSRIFTLAVAFLFMIITVLSAKNPAVIQRNINENFFNMIARSGGVERNPCLRTYRLNIKAITDDYEKNYDDCCAKADSKRNATNLKNLNYRNDLGVQSEMSCGDIQQCKSMSVVDKMYQCYENKGKENVKGFQVISNNASTELAKYLVELYGIDADESRCTDEAEIIFRTQNDKVYDDYSNCLSKKNSSPNPTSEPTQSPNPVETTTPASEPTQSPNPVETTTFNN